MVERTREWSTASTATFPAHPFRFRPHTLETTARAGDDGIETAFLRAKGKAGRPKTTSYLRLRRLVAKLGEKGPWKLPPGCVPLNRRSEILGKCRHKARFSLAKVVEPQEE